MSSLLTTRPLSFLPPLNDLEIAVRSAQKAGASLSGLLMKRAQLVSYPLSLVASSHTARDVRLSTQDWLVVVRDIERTLSHPVVGGTGDLL